MYSLALTFSHRHIDVNESFNVSESFTEAPLKKKLLKVPDFSLTATYRTGIFFKRLSFHLSVPPVFLLDAAAASKALRKDHQPGCEQEEQKGNGEKGRARAGKARSGEHEEEQTAGHQVSTIPSVHVKSH